MSMVALICEGDCNPQWAGLETDLKTFRKSAAGKPWPPDEGEKEHTSVVPTPPPELVTRLRSLRYTPHTFVCSRQDRSTVKGQLWQCRDCGRVRMWGLTVE